jgi:hypothetical protein
MLYRNYNKNNNICILLLLLFTICDSVVRTRFSDLPRTYIISLDSGNWEPNSIMCHIGDRIEWTWTGGPYNVVQTGAGNTPLVGGFNSGGLQDSGSFYWFPLQVGNYTYISSRKNQSAPIITGYISVGRPVKFYLWDQ